LGVDQERLCRIVTLYLRLVNLTTDQ